MDEYQYRFEEGEINKRWAVYKKPKDIYDMVEERKEHLKNERTKYEEELFQEQETYRKKFEATERIIRNFHTNNQIENHSAIFHSCSEIMHTLNSLL
jgi:DNA replication initiation complex subunit (GINS family)